MHQHRGTASHRTCAEVCSVGNQHDRGGTLALQAARPHGGECSTVNGRVILASHHWHVTSGSEKVGNPPSPVLNAVGSPRWTPTSPGPPTDRRFRMYHGANEYCTPGERHCSERFSSFKTCILLVC